MAGTLGAGHVAQEDAKVVQTVVMAWEGDRAPVNHPSIQLHLQVFLLGFVLFQDPQDYAMSWLDEKNGLFGKHMFGSYHWDSFG